MAKYLTSHTMTSGCEMLTVF